MRPWVRWLWFLPAVLQICFRLGLGKCTCSERSHAWSHVVWIVQVHRIQIFVRMSKYSIYSVLVQGRRTQTQNTDRPVSMHDACNDNGSRFGSDVFRVAGTIKYISHCNDYSTTPYRCNTTAWVIYVIRRPSEMSSGWTSSFLKSQVWQGMQLLWYNGAHRGPGPCFCDESCRDGTEVPVHITCNGGEKNISTSAKTKPKWGNNKKGEEGDTSRGKEEEMRGTRNVILTR